MIIQFSGGNYKVYVDDVEVATGDPFTIGGKITVKANVGFKIAPPSWATYIEPISIHIGINRSSYHSVQFPTDAPNYDSNMWVFEWVDTKSLTDKLPSATFIEVRVETGEDPTHEDTGGGDPGGDTGGGEKHISEFVTLFKASYETLDSMSTVQFFDKTFDINDWVHKIFVIPFNFDDTNVSTEKTPIVIGDFDTGITENTMLDDKLILDFGDIIVPVLDENVYGYRGVECLLYAPYLEDPITLPTRLVIGSTVNVKYAIDLYTGVTTINVTSGHLDTIIYRREVNMCRELPFTNKYRKDRSFNIDEYRFNDLDHTIIEVVRNVPYKNSNKFGKSCSEFGNLFNKTGYIEMSDVRLNVNCTSNEKEQIKNLLQQGIFINGLI